MVGDGVHAAGQRVVDMVGERFAEGFRVGSENRGFYSLLRCFCHKNKPMVLGLKIHEGKFRNLCLDMGGPRFAGRALAL